MSKKAEDKRYELKRLKEYCKIHGVPTQAELNNLSKKGILRSQTYYINNFGSLKNTYKLIGVTVKITEDEALKKLKEYFDKNGVESIPKFNKHCKELGLPSTNYYARHFGSWGKALKLIGFEKLQKENEWSDLSNVEILEVLKFCEIKIINQNRAFLRHRFKQSMYKILKMVGREFELAVKYLTKEDYIEIMKSEGKAITSDEFRKKYGSANNTKSFNQYFGSWNNFLKECGYEVNSENTPIEKTNEEIVKEYKEISLKKGYLQGMPTKLLKKELGYSAGFLAYRFGSVGNLKKLAGFQPVIKSSIWHKEEVLEFLSNKKRMTSKEIAKSKELPSLSTIFRMFKTTSINKVYEEIKKYKNN